MKLEELEVSEQCKCIGQDEFVGDKNTLNKERFLKEYFKRIQKIWKSEVNAGKKVIAHSRHSTSCPE